MKLLRLTPALKATSSSYNQFSLGFKKAIEQTVGSLQKHQVQIDDNITVFHGDGSAYKLFKQIRKFINRNNYDVIHIHNSSTGIIFLFAIFPFKLKLLNKTIFTLHNSWNVFKPRNQFLNIILMLLSHKVCTCGKSSHESLPTILKYFIYKKTNAIINGFDHERIDRVSNKKSREIHFDESAKVKILYIGSLINIKNQIAFLEVLNLLDIEAEIIFLGEGINKKSLIEFSKKISNSIKISFKGLVSREIAIEHMLEADVYISLSKGEGLPIAALEAMYSGCFMILSKIPPHKEISPPTERCLYVDIENTQEIINSLKYVINNIEELKNKREVSKNYSISNFSVKKMLDDYQNVYDSLC